MKRLIVSCGMLAEELKKACAGQSVLPEIIEQPRGMHEHPKELKERLSVLISEHQNVDEIVLTYGLCGYGTVGLISENTRLVRPDLMTASASFCTGKQRGAPPLENTGRASVPDRWMDQRQKICTGAVQGDHGNLRRKCAGDLRCDLRRVSYHGCDRHRVHIILEETEKNAEEICRYLPLKKEKITGSCDILKRIISGDYDDNFIVLNPRRMPVTEQMFRFNGR